MEKFTEDVIIQENNPKNTVLTILFIVLAVVSFLGMIVTFLALIVFIPSVVCLFLLKRVKNVQYEFTMLSEEVRVSAIYNLERRKSLKTFDLSNVKLMAPYESGRVEHERAQSKKTYKYTTNANREKIYSLIFEDGGQKCEMVVEPTEKILNHLKELCKNVYYED